MVLTRVLKPKINSIRQRETKLIENEMSKVAKPFRAVFLLSRESTVASLFFISVKY